MHQKEKHPQNIKCKLCEETFDKNSDLEGHIKTCHDESEIHECEDCGKTFALKWRLRKHKENHGRIGTKNCHYFNNEKGCLYESIGCMAKSKLKQHVNKHNKHEKATKCNFCTYEDKTWRGLKSLKRHYENDHMKENI